MSLRNSYNTLKSLSFAKGIIHENNPKHESQPEQELRKWKFGISEDERSSNHSRQ